MPSNKFGVFLVFGLTTLGNWEKLIEHSPLDLVSNGNPRFCWLTTCDEEHSLYEEHCTSQSQTKLTYSLTEFNKQN